LKVATLNDLYNAKVFSVFSVVNHIQSLKIDERLQNGDISLVKDISDTTVNGKKHKHYSFATKYCSHHNPSAFPIYDSYVDEVLRYFRKQDKFSSFNNYDLKNYEEFKNIIIQFMKYYGLENYTFKQIDIYLRQIAKMYLPKK
jgi:hypothetical protein